MRPLSSRFNRCLLEISLCTCAASPAFALDPVCAQLKAAMDAARIKPFHTYTTTTTTVSGAMKAAAATLGMGGTEQSEEISTGKTFYVLSKGRWIDMQINFARMEKDKDNDPDAQEAARSSKCQVLPDETVFDEPASVFLETTQSLGVQTKLWVLKSTHLPIRTDITVGAGGLKTVSSSRYVFANVLAPLNAITMKDMMTEKAKH